MVEVMMTGMGQDTMIASIIVMIMGVIVTLEEKIWVKGETTVLRQEKEMSTVEVVVTQ